MCATYYISATCVKSIACREKLSHSYSIRSIARSIRRRSVARPNRRTILSVAPAPTGVSPMKTARGWSSRLTAIECIVGQVVLPASPVPPDGVPDQARPRRRIRVPNRRAHRADNPCSFVVTARCHVLSATPAAGRAVFGRTIIWRPAQSLTIRRTGSVPIPATVGRHRRNRRSSHEPTENRQRNPRRERASRGSHYHSEPQPDPRRPHVSCRATRVIRHDSDG